MHWHISVVATAAALCISCHSWAAEQFSGTPAAFKGAYLIYSGSLDDWGAPTKVDAKVYLEIHGDAAKRIYAQMGSTAQRKACDAQTKLRAVGDTDCVQSTNGEFICHIGVDLKSGKSIIGSIC